MFDIDKKVMDVEYTNYNYVFVSVVSVLRLPREAFYTILNNL